MSRRPALIQRQRDIDRVDDMTVKVTRYQGRVQVLGSGEFSIDIPFPVRFSQKPIFHHGLEFAEESWPTAGSYPVYGATVSTWVREGQIEGAFDGYYTGATIVGRIEAESANFWLHYSFDGKALRNPLSGMDGTGDTI